MATTRRERSSARLRGGQPEPFHYVDLGTMATISRFRAVAAIGSGSSSRASSRGCLWLEVHLTFLTGFKNRVVGGGQLDRGVPRTRPAPAHHYQAAGVRTRTCARITDREPADDERRIRESELSIKNDCERARAESEQSTKGDGTMTTSVATTPAKAGTTTDQKLEQLRELFADAPGGGQGGAREGAPGADVAGDADAAAAGGERRPGRQPAGQGLGADDHRPASRPAEPSGCARSCGCSAATSPARTTSAPSTTCASCSWTTTRGCSSPPPTTATGTPTSTTSRRRSPTTWTSSTPPGRAGRGFAARRRRTTSPSTRSRQKAGTSPMT